MTTITNSFEGGTNGTAMAIANTGGASGAPFDIVSTSSSSVTPIFDTTHAAHGSLAMQIATGSTAASSYVGWTGDSTGGATTTIYFRAYLYFTAYPSASATLFRVLSGTSVGCSLQTTSSGVLRFLSSSSQQVALTTAFPLNQWFRVEGMLTADTVNGTCELRRFDNPDSTTATEVKTGSGQVYTPLFDAFRFGLQSSTASWGPVWYDDLAVSTTAFVGPVGGTPITPPAAAVPVNTGLPAVTGVAQVGELLTADVGAWTGAPTSYAYQWATDGTNVTGATSATYTVAAGDLGKSITVTVTATNGTGASSPATSPGTAGVNPAGAGSTLAYWFENPNKTIPSGAHTYSNSGSLASAISGTPTNGTLVLDYNGTRTEDIDMALPNGITIMNAPGKRPWVDGNVRFSAGENVKIYGLSVTWSHVTTEKHMVYWDGGSGEWAYSEFTLQGQGGCFTLLRPGQNIHNWQVHHSWIHDNPGVSSHDGNQDHGFYCSATNTSQNGRVHHCLIETMPRGRNIKIGGPSSGGSIGDIVVDHNTLVFGHGPSNGQTSNGTENTSWHHNLLIDSGDKTNLTEGPGSGGGNTYSYNKGDKPVGPNSSNFKDAGNNVSNVSGTLLSDYVTQGKAGYGHLDGSTSGTTVNSIPVANAGGDQTNKAPGSTVTLTGTGTDTDGTIVSYNWTQTTGPTVTLSGSGATRTFTAPTVTGGTTLTFSLTVTDNGGATSPADTMTVAVNAPAGGGTLGTITPGAVVTNFSTSGTATPSVNVPSDAVAGNQLFALLAYAGDEQVDPPSGWTEISNGALAQDGRFSLVTRVMTAGITSAQWSIQTSTTGTYGKFAAMMGTTKGSQSYAVGDVVNRTASSSTTVLPAVTVPTNGLLLAFAVDRTSSPTTVVGPSGMTEWAKYINGGGSGVTVYAGYQQAPVSGTKTITYGTASVNGAGLMIALDPTVGTPPVTTVTTPTATVSLGSTISLAGTSSGAASVRWSQTAGPTTTTIANPTSAASASVTPVVPGTYVFRLTGTNSDGVTYAEATRVVAATTSRPISTISNAGGFTIAGGAVSIEAALADSSDSTYAEGAAPTGSTLTELLAPLDAGAGYTMHVRARSTIAPVHTIKVDLMQGTTVIATRTQTLSTSLTTYPFTLTSTEATAITNRNDLRIRVTTL